MSSITNHIPKTKLAPRQAFVVESAGMTAAEFVGAAVSVGTIASMDVMFPNQVKEATHYVAKHLIEPHLDRIEKGLTSVCKLKECQPDPNKSREERAENLARAVVLFGGSWLPGLLAKLGTRWFINEKCGINHMDAGRANKNPMHVSKHDLAVLIADEGVHYGSMLYLNNAGARFNESMLQATTSMLEKCGMDHKKAQDVAMLTVVHELPNLLGLAASFGVIGHQHFKK
jgi:hypothetical protein